jgi:hypothetical protein
MGLAWMGGKSVGRGVIEGVGVGLGRGVIVGIVGVILGSTVASTVLCPWGASKNTGMMPGPGVKVGGRLLGLMAVSPPALVGTTAAGINVGKAVAGVQAVVSSKKVISTRYQYK